MSILTRRGSYNTIILLVSYPDLSRPSGYSYTVRSGYEIIILLWLNVMGDNNDLIINGNLSCKPQLFFLDEPVHRFLQKPCYFLFMLRKQIMILKISLWLHIRKCLILNSNRTKWRPIRSENIRVINKIGWLRFLSFLVNREYGDSRSRSRILLQSSLTLKLLI